MSQLGESIDQNKVINFLNKIFLSFSASATILCQITTNYNTALRQLYVQIPHQSFFFKLNSIENQHRWMHLRKSHRLVILSNNSKQYLVIFGAFSIVICKWSPQMISNVIINTVIQRPSFSLGILLEILWNSAARCHDIVWCAFNNSIQ